MQTFYDGVIQLVRSTIDTTMGGTLMNKIGDEAYNLIEEMTLNNYQWLNKRSQPKVVGGKLELNAIIMLNNKVNICHISKVGTFECEFC